jgi:hypothetical protein
VFELARLLDQKFGWPCPLETLVELRMPPEAKRQAHEARSVLLDRIELFGCKN